MLRWRREFKIHKLQKWERGRKNVMGFRQDMMTRSVRLEREFLLGLVKTERGSYSRYQHANAQLLCSKGVSKNDE